MQWLVTPPPPLTPRGGVSRNPRRGPLRFRLPPSVCLSVCAGGRPFALGIVRLRSARAQLHHALLTCERAGRYFTPRSMMWKSPRGRRPFLHRRQSGTADLCKLDAARRVGEHGGHPVTERLCQVMLREELAPGPLPTTRIAQIAARGVALARRVLAGGTRLGAPGSVGVLEVYPYATLSRLGSIDERLRPRRPEESDQAFSDRILSGFASEIDDLSEHQAGLVSVPRCRCAGRRLHRLATPVRARGPAARVQPRQRLDLDTPEDRGPYGDQDRARHTLTLESIRSPEPPWRRPRQPPTPQAACDGRFGSRRADRCTDCQPRRSSRSRDLPGAGSEATEANPHGR
jgi:hypothetical protein